ncbi:hypothetical protein [Streptomyces sp. 8L]|uniref:hypothetical protein n=1 Tax=Streptomyces sp. 8L TaxID=2877242 RepID=UPI001CD6C2AE|nr:hypothetical protein [Streptomyces sp. 8L]MCA1223703.1 hypothetical protein [Streptomyces sp. 8L]
MSNARRFLANTMTDAQIKNDITRDIAANHGAQQRTPNDGELAAGLARNVDNALDELNELQAGTWRINHT